MKLLKKPKKKKMSVGKPLKAIDLMGQLMERKMLRTTTTGAFYTFPEVLNIGPTPANLVKNMYLYARTTNLIQKGQTLYIRNIDPDEDVLLGQYDPVNGWVPV